MAVSAKFGRRRCWGGSLGLSLPAASFFVVLAVATLGSTPCRAMSFDMQYQTKCLFQDIENGQASTIEWRAISKSSMEAQLRDKANIFSEEDADSVLLNVLVTSPVPR